MNFNTLAVPSEDYLKSFTPKSLQDINSEEVKENNQKNVRELF